METLKRKIHIKASKGYCVALGGGFVRIGISRATTMPCFAQQAVDLQSDTGLNLFIPCWMESPHVFAVSAALVTWRGNGLGWVRGEPGQGRWATVLSKSKMSATEMFVGIPCFHTFWYFLDSGRSCCMWQFFWMRSPMRPIADSWELCQCRSIHVMEWRFPNIGTSMKRRMVIRIMEWIHLMDPVNGLLFRQNQASHINW